MTSISMVQDYIIADEIARLQSLTKEELVSEIVSLKFDNNKTYEIRKETTK